MSDSPGTAAALDEDRLRSLIEVGRELVSDLDTESVLRRLLEVAQSVTGAHFAAFGVTDADGAMEGLVASGAVAEDPDRGAFESEADSLSVPIRFRGQTYGNLHLTQKNEGEFDAGDEAAALILADWAGIAIENARLYTNAVERRTELERAVARLEATSEMARAVGGETRLDRVLEAVASRSQALVEASVILVLLEDRGQLAIAATAGPLERDLRGARLPADGSAWRNVMSEGEPERVDDLGDRLGISLNDLGIGATSALLVPLSFRNRAVGVVAALDRAGPSKAFDAEDEVLLNGFAASAAMAITNAQSMAEARLRESIRVAELERARWARELHDETLQGLGALRVRLATSLRLDAATRDEAVATAVTQIEDEIANLRSLITELRPAALDELGLGAAIESLAENHGATTGLDVSVEVALAREDGLVAERLERELESAVYRVVQEALTNVAKHASAENVWIEVAQEDDAILIVVRDDGVGFNMDDRGTGFGLIGMRERVALGGGSLAIVSTPGVGTELRGRIPIPRAGESYERG